MANPAAPPPTSRLTLPLGLAPHISALNALALLLSAAVSISLLVFLNAAQPFLLDLLRVPSDHAGALTGKLILVDQLAALSLALVWGALADRVGIRAVVPAGYGLVGVGLGAYGLARGEGQLVWFRLVFASGASALTTTLSTALGLMSAVPGAEPMSDAAVDPEAEPLLAGRSRPTGNARRGSAAARFAGLLGFASGAGALLAVFGYLRLPTALASSFPSLSDGAALRLTFAATATIAVAQGLFLLRGFRLRPDPSAPPQAAPQAEGDLGGAPAKPSFATELKHAARELPAGFVLARHDAQVALAFGAAFAARAASIVIAAYISLLVNLYFTNHGLCSLPEVPPTLHAFLAAGDEPSETCRPAYILSSILSGTAQLCALLSAPLTGLLAARFPPHLALLLTSLIGAACFPLFGLRSDPRGGLSILFAVGLGIAQIGATVVSLGMLASARGRIVASEGGGGREKGGALGAAYSVCGGLGILVVGRLGGGLVRVSAGAPFVIMGVVNGLMVVACLVVYMRSR